MKTQKALSKYIENISTSSGGSASLDFLLTRLGDSVNKLGDDDKLMLELLSLCFNQDPDLSTKICISGNNFLSKKTISIACVWLYVIKNTSHAPNSVEPRWIKTIKKHLKEHINKLSFDEKDKLFNDFASLFEDKTRLLSNFVSSNNKKNNLTNFILPLFYTQEKSLEGFLVKCLSVTEIEKIPQGKLNFEKAKMPVKISKAKVKYICRRIIPLIFPETKDAKTHYNHPGVSIGGVFYESDAIMAQDDIEKFFLPGLMQISNDEAKSLVQSLIDVLSDKSSSESKKSLKFNLEIQSKDKPKQRASRKF